MEHSLKDALESSQQEVELSWLWHLCIVLIPGPRMGDSRSALSKPMLSYHRPSITFSKQLSSDLNSYNKYSALGKVANETAIFLQPHALFSAELEAAKGDFERQQDECQVRIR